MKNQQFIEVLPLETSRLIIRPVSIEDVDLLLKMDNQKITQKFLGGIKTKTREERIEFLKKKIDRFKDGHAGQLTICLKDGTSIGFMGFSINEKNNNAELSYLFDYDYCNNGYCTEACQKLIEVGFNTLNLNKVFADTIDGNESSKRVLEKLGFEKEGIRREAAYIEEIDEYKDFLDYGLLKKEYR